MSFGFSPSDVVLLVQSAWTTVQNSRKACGEYAELTREITSLHVNLQRLERETAKPESPINRPSDTCRQDLAPIVDGCGKALDVLDRILEKYNALSDEERSKRKLWKAVRFGNGELANIKDLRLKLTYYTSNLSLFLNMVSMGSMGIVEKQMYEAGGDLKNIRRAVNGITAHLMSAANREGSGLTDYADDDKAVWRAFRRELIKGGFSSDVIRDHKYTIQAYVKELGSRGILDDEDFQDSENVSEEMEDTAPAQATSQSLDEATGSFEHKTGAARDDLSPRTSKTGHVEGLSGNVNRDVREDQKFPQQTQTAPTPLTIDNISDTPPSTTQADAEIDSVVESDLREVEKADDGKNGPRSSAPSPLVQNPTELAKEDTWFLSGKIPRDAFKYINYDYDNDGNFWVCRPFTSKIIREVFEALSDPSVARGETLEFRDEAKGFLKVAEHRTRLGKRGSNPDGGSWLRLSPLFEEFEQDASDSLFRVIKREHPNKIISKLLHFGLAWIDAHPGKWRITEWPSPPKRAEGEGHEDGDKSKRSTVPPRATPAVVEDTQDPSSITKEVGTKDDNKIVRIKDKARTEEEKGMEGELGGTIEGSEAHEGTEPSTQKRTVVNIRPLGARSTPTNYPFDGWGPPFRGNLAESCRLGGRGLAIEGIHR